MNLYASGVYRITNILNNKIYIGSSKSKIKNRINQHFHYLRKGTHPNLHLQNSYNKYGESSFKYNVLENCQSDITYERELFWITKFGCFDNKVGYNKELDPIKKTGIKRTKEIKERLSFLKKQYANTEKGKLQLKALHNLIRGSKFKKSKESIEKTAIANSKSFIVQFPDNTIKIIFNLTDFCRINGLRTPNLSSTNKNLHGKYKQKQHKGYKVLLSGSRYEIQKEYDKLSNQSFEIQHDE